MQLAAVDLGSNSFRLEIGRVEGSHIARVGYWKETVRLAAGLDGEGRLSKKAIAIAVDTLARMNERLRGMGAEHVRAVGTQTLRQARNVDEFLLEAQDALGYPIEVISGREEARLIFEGCSHELPLTDQPRLVVDIGGASTEMIVGTGFTASSAESFKVGCVNTSLRFFKDGRIDRPALKRAQVAAAAEIEEAVSLFGSANWSEAYGSSGTVGAVSEILRAEGWSDGTITADGLQRVRGAVLEAGEVGRIRLAGMKPDRQSVIAGGLAVLSAVFDTLGVTVDEAGARWPARRCPVRPARAARAQGRPARDRRARAEALRRGPRPGRTRAPAGARAVRRAGAAGFGGDGQPAALGRDAARGRFRDLARRLSQALGLPGPEQRPGRLLHHGPGTDRNAGARAARQPEEDRRRAPGPRSARRRSSRCASP